MSHAQQPDERYLKNALQQADSTEEVACKYGVGTALGLEAHIAAKTIRAQHAHIADLEATHLRELAAYRTTVENLERKVAELEAAPAAQVVEPEFFTVFASHNGGKIALPGYSNETEKGVKDLVLQAARQEGYKGTVSGRLLEMGWWIGPVFANPYEAASPAPAAVAVPSVLAALKEARAVISSINRGPSHAVTVGDETCFWQRDEWVKWATQEVLPLVEAALSAPAPAAVAVAEALELLKLYRNLCAGDLARTHSSHQKRINTAIAALAATPPAQAQVFANTQEKTMPFNNPVYEGVRAAVQRDMHAGAAWHPDTVAVYRFADEMAAKMEQARAKGRGGWETCPPEVLSTMLREHVEKGDPRDVANFCMMLCHLGHPITPAPQAQDVQRDALDDTALLDAMTANRIAVVPEFEGPWDAEIYREEGEPVVRGSGNTPREAIRAAIAASAAQGEA